MSELMAALHPAVLLAMDRVTEASMDTVVSERDWWMRQHARADDLGYAATTLVRDAKDRGMTDAEQAQLVELRAEVKMIRARCDTHALGLLTQHADDLLYGGPHCAATFTVLAGTLAHLAHLPQGVVFGGYHWCIEQGHRGVAADFCIVEEAK